MADSSSVNVNPIDVVRIMAEQIGNLSKDLAMWQARAEQAERTVEAMKRSAPSSNRPLRNVTDGA